MSGASLVFLRGLGSAPWLNLVGKIYEPNAELYRRHLEFPAFTSGSRDYFVSPSLPSASARALQLIVPTICTRNVGATGYEPEDLEHIRAQASKAMAKYFGLLRDRGGVADSIVRECLILSDGEYILEQTISIEVGTLADTWRVIIWLDSGRDLAHGIPGPWNPTPGMKAWETYFYPVIVQQADDKTAFTFRNHTENDDSVPLTLGTTNRPTTKDYGTWIAAQNVSLLPSQYGSALDKGLASRDALYALSELLHFAASAEVQVLNLIDKSISRELSFIGVEGLSHWSSTSLLNLKYIKSILASHAPRMAMIVDILRNRQSLDWPRDDESSVAAKSAAMLLADYEHLVRRIDSLARECKQGMATLANSSVLEESKRSADTGIRVQRRTIIATVFIPLSFVCSVWGTNFKEFGSGSKPVWMLVASTGPVILLSCIIYNWDWIKQLSQRIITTQKKKETVDAEA